MSLTEDIQGLLEAKDATIFEQALEIAELRKTIASDFMAGVVIEKDAEIAKLKKTWEHSQEGNRAWLAEFDHYKARLAAARRVIQFIGTVRSGDGDVIRAAEEWLRGRP